MNSQIDATTTITDPEATEATDITIPELVAQVYERAPAAERGRMLEQLLRPLGVLSLVAVAGGMFAKIRLRSGWQDMHVRLDDLQLVRAADVRTLVDYVQPVSYTHLTLPTNREV